MNISYSRVSTFRKCHARHYYSYIKDLEPKTQHHALQFGKDFHKLVEHWNKGIPEPEIESDDHDYVTNLMSVYLNFIAHYKSDRTMVGAEIRFDIPEVLGEDIFVGVIDRLEVDEYGDLHITDYKTFSREPNQAVLGMDLQSLLYAKAVEILYGKLPTSMTWVYVRSTAPEPPTYLEKSQRYSRSFGSTVTLETWNTATGNQPLSDDEVQKLKNNEERFIFEVTMPIQPEIVSVAWSDFTETVNHIRGGSKVMSVGHQCATCPYLSICQARLGGGDVDYVISQDFRRRKEK